MPGTLRERSWGLLCCLSESMLFLVDGVLTNSLPERNLCVNHHEEDPVFQLLLLFVVLSFSSCSFNYFS